MSTAQQILNGPPTPVRGHITRAKRAPEFEVALGARIRALRVAAKMTQTGLGQAVGLSYQQVQKYETAKDRVSVSTLKSIADALNVHLGSFFDDDMPSPTRSVPDVRAAAKSADILGQISDPHVLKQLLALAKALVDGQARGAHEIADGVEA